jgi:NAD(P)-dependent dehydrogenase (short-subunit alcohol dehydrogenase family)
VDSAPGLDRVRGAIEGAGRLAREAARLRGVPESDIRRELISESALATGVHGMDVAAAVVFLASEAAGNITGQDLNVSAGAVMY